MDGFVRAAVALQELRREVLLSGRRGSWHRAAARRGGASKRSRYHDLIKSRAVDSYSAPGRRIFYQWNQKAAKYDQRDWALNYNYNQELKIMNQT